MHIFKNSIIAGGFFLLLNVLYSCINDTTSVPLMPAPSIIPFTREACTDSGFSSETVSSDTGFYHKLVINTDAFDPESHTLIDTIILHRERFETQACQDINCKKTIKWKDEEKTKGDTAVTCSDSTPRVEILGSVLYDSVYSSSIPLAGLMESLDSGHVVNISVQFDRVLENKSFRDSLPSPTSLQRNDIGNEPEFRIGYSVLVTRIDSFIIEHFQRRTDRYFFLRKGMRDTALILEDTSSFVVDTAVITSDTSWSVQKSLTYPLSTIPHLNSIVPSLGAMLDMRIAYPETLDMDIQIPPDSAVLWKVDNVGWPGQPDLVSLGDSGTNTISLFAAHSIYNIKAQRSLQFGGFTGAIIAVDDAGSIFRQSFQLQKTWEDFFPEDSVLTNFWNVPEDAGKFLGSSSLFTLTSDISMPAPTPQDSIAMVSSRFRLVGDFGFEVRINLPGTVLKGYTIALFVSDTTSPNFHSSYLPEIWEGFSLYQYDGAGIYFNGRYGQQEAPDFVAFGPKAGGAQVNIPHEVILRLERTGDIFSISRIEEDASRLELYRSPETVASDSLRIFMGLGNYHESSVPVSAGFTGFRIFKGKMAF